jgi:uncharacterized membrane protein YfcA
MDFLSGSNDLGTLGLGLLMAGAAAGLFSGVLGRGAGLILVPALFLVARSTGLTPDRAMPLAIGTSFACLVPLALSTLAGHKYDRAPTRGLQMTMLPGVAAAAVITAAVRPGIWQIAAFAAAALAAVVLTLTAWNGRSGPGPRGIAGSATAFVCALVPGLTGTSGASLTTPALMLWGMERKQAAGVAAELAVAIAAVGAVVATAAGWNAPGLPRFSYGYVNLLAFGIAAPVAFVTNLIATHYADMLEAKKLRLLFAAFVVFSVARMVWSVVG